MKNFYLVLVVVAILVITVGAAFAQDPLKFGIKAGVSISTWETDSEFLELDSRTAFAGGAFLIYDLTGIWAVQVEGLYVPKGGTSEQMGVDENEEETGLFTATFQSNYLEIPVLARISLGSSPVHLLFGPAIAFKLSSKLTADDAYGADGGDYEFELDFIESSDFGLVFGAGVDFTTSFGLVIFDARYTH